MINNESVNERPELKGLREFAAKYLAENAQLKPVVAQTEDSNNSPPPPDITAEEEADMPPTIRRNSGGYTSYVFISNDEQGGGSVTAPETTDPRVTVNLKVSDRYSFKGTLHKI